MNRNLNEYRLFCQTENAYVFTYNEVEPRSCPNDGAHVVDQTKTAVVSARPENIFPVTSFDELRVAERTGIIELKSVFGKSALRDMYLTTGAGASINNNVGDAEFQLAVTGASDVAWLRSTERGRYVAGLQGEVGVACRNPQALQGNQTLRIGLFDQSNGFFFEHAAGDVVRAVVMRDGQVVVSLPMTEWNIDRFDGKGPSRYVFDARDGIIYNVRFTWYGYGNIEFRLNVTNPDNKQSSWLGHIYNPYAQTSVKTPNLPISVRLANNGTAVPAQAFVAGRQYSLLGKYDAINRVNCHYRVNATVPLTFAPIISIRRKQGYLGNPIKAFAADVLSNVDVIVQFRVFVSLTGASWGAPADTSPQETAVEVDTSATAASGGTPIWTGVIAGTSKTTNATNLDISYDLPEFDILTIFGRTVSANNASVTTAFRWTEEW
jgi:hypothetical protein